MSHDPRQTSWLPSCRTLYRVYSHMLRVIKAPHQQTLPDAVHEPVITTHSCVHLFICYAFAGERGSSCGRVGYSTQLRSTSDQTALHHINVTPIPAAWPSATESWATAGNVHFQMEAFEVDSLADVLLCRPELLDGNGGVLDAQLLVLQLLRELQALHTAGRAHGNIQLRNLQLHDCQ